MMPMATDTGAVALVSSQPWSEKYRPKSLEEVAAHKDIIDTSKWAHRARRARPRAAQRPPC